jgi:REP element-mobilizing transposase RayT
MPRAVRIVVPGVAHHITQRGNNRADVFFVEEDRRVYLELLRRGAERHGLRVEGYCLMTNHVHVVAVPEREESLSGAMAFASLVYTRRMNRLHGRLARRPAVAHAHGPALGHGQLRHETRARCGPPLAGTPKRPAEGLQGEAGPGRRINGKSPYLALRHLRLDILGGLTAEHADGADYSDGFGV